MTAKLALLYVWDQDIEPSQMCWKKTISSDKRLPLLGAHFMVNYNNKRLEKYELKHIGKISF